MLKNVILIFIILLSGCNNSLKPEPPIPTTMGKHGLFIGIQNYRNVPSLRGSINDVKLIEGVLRERFGFKEKDFITLLDKQATHTGIENAFKTLIDRVQPNDFVYIHYSGHGSSTADLNGDEPGGEDQTWVSYGTRGGNIGEKDNYDVLDDEINSWLGAIYAKTHNVIFVSDSCHSGSVARGEAPVIRGLSRDERSYPLGKKQYSQLDKYYGIHIGSAQNDEFASETVGEDGKHYGLFTWHWAKALQQAQAGQTWNDVFKQTYSAITSLRGETQHPQMEGERNRQVFGGELTPLSATISVTKVQGDLIEIQAGSLAGVTVGSIYRLSNSSQNSPQLEITEVNAFVSQGKASRYGAFKPGDLVIEASHTYHFDPVKVYLSADFPNGKDKNLLQTLQTAFHRNKFPGYILNDDPYNVDLRLHFLHPKRENGEVIYENQDDALPKPFPNQAPELWVLTPEEGLFNKNLQIRFTNSQTGIKLLQENLKKIARIREIKALQSNSSQSLSGMLDIYHLTPVKACSVGKNCVELPQNLGLHKKTGPYSLQELGKLTVKKGELFSFSLHNQSEQDYYYYLLDISPDGAIYAIFPDSQERMESARIKAGEKRDLNEDVLLMMEEVGAEILKLIVSTQPIDVSLLEQDIFRQRGSGNLNPLERLLVSVAHGQRGLVRVPNAEWITEQVTFEVK